MDIEITSSKVYQHLLIIRDRKINELATWELDLKDWMKKYWLSYSEISGDVSSLVNLFKYIKATKIVMRYCNVLKEHSIKIADACNKKNYETLHELIIYFEGIVWSSSKLNLSYINEFTRLIENFFGI